MESKKLPLFPLNLVPFPGEEINLHIFEPRYRQLVKDCLEQDSTFVIPVFLNGTVGEYGTEMKIVEVVKKYERGEMDIKTVGLNAVRVIQFKKRETDKLYPGGMVVPLENIDDEDFILREKIDAELDKLYEVLKIQRSRESSKSFDIAHYIGMNLEQELNLLQITRESDRQTIILEHLRKVIPVIIETERMKKLIQMNGHFKHLNPLDF